MGKKTNPVEHRTPLSAGEREMMMAVALRNPTAFLQFREVLKPESFSELDVKYAVVWQVACNYYDKFSKLPKRKALTIWCGKAVQDDPDVLTDTEIDDLSAFIEVIFDPKEWDDEDLSNSDDLLVQATDYLRQYMEERLTATMRERVVSKGRLVADLLPVLAEFQTEVQRFHSVGDAGGNLDAFPDGWDIEGGIGVRTTGLAFLDHLLDGGHAPGEVYGIMGPFGSCKTTLAVMLAVQGARHALARNVEDPDFNGYSFFFSYEARIKELRHRALMFAAEIDRKSLETMGKEGLKALSTAKKGLKEYEQKRFAHAIDSGEKVLGEQGRANRALKYLRNRVVFVDLTGYDLKRRGCGGGFIPEVARLLGMELRARGANAKAVSVVIDYVGAMARRHLMTMDRDESALRHLITGAGLAARNMISDQYDCPTWLIHQLSGDANKKLPGGRYHHTDAAESKSFAENLDFCIVVGNLTNQGLGQLAATKHRRAAAMDPVVIQLEGDFGTVRYPSKEYVVDPQTYSIKEKDLQNSTTSGTLKSKKKTSAAAMSASVIATNLGCEGNSV